MKALLLVEDDKTTREQFVELFAQDGWDVRAAVNGLDALALLEGGFVPAVLLTDLIMPKMSGSELVAVVRKRPEWAGVSVVAMTALEGEANAEVSAARGLGVPVLRKPFEAKELENAIRGKS